MEKVLGPGAQAREGEYQFEEDELLPRLDRPNNVDINKSRYKNIFQWNR